MNESSPELSAATMIGLLAEDDRLKAVAALVLGETTLDGVAARAGLDLRKAAAALERLGSAGLVVADPQGGGLRLASERFKAAARSEAALRAAAVPLEEFGGVATESAAVLRNFVSDGRLRQIPASRSKRLIVLDWLVTRFEPGKIYPERDVNQMVALVHPDVAALRRYLVDEQLLERRDGFYWRTGGTFEVD